MGLAQTRPRRCRRAPERCAERRRNLSGVRTRTGTLIDSAAVPPLREERPCAVAATSAGRHDDLRALRHALAHVATQHLAQERRSEEHTSELQSLMRISYAVFCLKKKTETKQKTHNPVIQ